MRESRFTFTLASTMPVPTILRRASAKAAHREGRTNQSAPAGQLPPEVLLLILAHLRNSPDVANGLEGDGIPRVDRAVAGAPRICQAWSAAATYELYHDVALPDMRACMLFLRTLKGSPALASYVRGIALPLCSSTSRGAATVKAKHKAAQCPATDIFSEILQRLPGVRAVRVQDLHVSQETLVASLSHIETLVVDNRYSACTVVRPGYPQLIYAGH